MRRRYPGCGRCEPGGEAGGFIAILGHNGSGNHTCQAYQCASGSTSGTIWWMENHFGGNNIWDIRQTAGMVFQNPDNQIIGQVVEEMLLGPKTWGSHKGNINLVEGKPEGGGNV